LKLPGLGRFVYAIESKAFSCNPTGPLWIL
jgi:hypothetical protein